MKINIRSKQFVLCLISLSVLFFVVLRIIIIYSKGTDIAGIEQNVVYSIQVFLNGGQLYSSPHTAPFSITQYTPLYYWLCYITAKIGDYGPYDIQNIYIIGRSWNLLFNLINALIIFKISSSILRISINKSYFLFLLAFAFTYSHNFAIRPDSLHDMIGIGSIYAYLCYYNKSSINYRSTSLLFITVVLTAVSVFSKQSGIQLIIIFMGFSFLSRDWKTLGKLFLFSSVIYGISLGFFHYLYPSFIDNVVGGVMNGINIENFINYVIGKKIFIICVLPLIFISLFFLIKNNSIFKGDEVTRLLSISLLGTLIFALATALKMGSTIQYFNIFVNVALLLIFKNIQDLKERKELVASKVFSKELTFYGFLFLVIFIYAATNSKLILNFDHDPRLEKQRLAAVKVAEYIKEDSKSSKGRYIFSNLTTDTTIPSRQGINNIFFKNCLVPQMDILEYSTGPSKVIGYNNLEKMLKNGDVKYIIESEPKSKFSIVKNLEQIKISKFRIVKNIEGYLIYKSFSNQ